MAITPQEAKLLTDLELGMVESAEEDIDNALRVNWNPGNTVRIPIKKHWRKEVIIEIARRYQKSGWVVSHQEDSLFFKAL